MNYALSSLFLFPSPQLATHSNFFRFRFFISLFRFRIARQVRSAIDPVIASSVFIFYRLLNMPLFSTNKFLYRYNFSFVPEKDAFMQTIPTG